MKGEIVIMRKTLMVVLGLVMALTLVIGSASTVSAGKPTPSFSCDPVILLYDDAGIYGEAGEVYIECSLNWSNIGAWGYKVEWKPTWSANTSSLTAGGKRLRNYSGPSFPLSINETYIDQNYSINTTLLDRRGNSMGWWHADIVVPSSLMVRTTAIFAEHFTGIADYELPLGWSTNSTMGLCYALDNDSAGGVGPELEIDPDDSVGKYGYSDYWVSTPEIETAPATSNLTLSFKHWFFLTLNYEEGYNYTIAVEVSADNITWSPTSFVDSPNFTKYPDGGDGVGPETVNIDLSTYAGQTIMVRWRVWGYTYWMGVWTIDDVVLTGY
jgi:hypothetical protein